MAATSPRSSASEAVRGGVGPSNLPSCTRTWAAAAAKSPCAVHDALPSCGAVRTPEEAASPTIIGTVLA